MIELNKYTRVAFHVDAVQVTADNIGEVADWCGGEVRTAQNDGVDAPQGSPFIKVRVKRPLTPRQTRAFVGDWVLYAGTGFKVYTDNAFQKCFEPIVTLADTEKLLMDIFTTPADKKVLLEAHETELDSVSE